VGVWAYPPWVLAGEGRDQKPLASAMGSPQGWDDVQPQR
jgi:hypothetical protein